MPSKADCVCICPFCAHTHSHAAVLYKLRFAHVTSQLDDIYSLCNSLYLCVYLFMWAHAVRVSVCARTCLYGEISRSNRGRARVNSGTNACKTRGRKGSVGKDQEVQISHSSCSLSAKQRLEETVINFNNTTVNVQGI